MNEINKNQIENVRAILSQLIPLTESAESKFRSAKNWGIFDILGGGFIVDMIKHYKLNSASNDMSRINMLLQQLQRELNQIVMPVDFTMNVSGLAMFADFAFDGFLSDIYMQSKINSSWKQVKELLRRLYILRDEMNRLVRQ